MSAPNSAFAKLAELGRKLEAIEHAQSMLSVDEAVMMPTGGGEKRAESMSILAGMYHEMATAPEIADRLQEASEEPLDEMQQAAIREQQRMYTNMTCLNGDFVRKQVIGMLGFDSEVPGYFTTHLANLALAFANQAAVAIEQSPCSEIFASHPDGKLVVVLERANSTEIMERIDAMRELPGVLSVELAYQHAEAAAAMQEVLS